MTIITVIFFLMILTQSIAYLWFQSKGGVVSHKNYMIANGCFMVGQSAQAIESFANNAWASFSIATFYFIITSIGIVRRFMIMKKEKARS